MTWADYYDKFYDWAESTRISKLSSVDKLGSADEVAEVMLEFAYDHEDVVNRIARKALEQRIVFTADNIRDLTNSIDPELQAKLAIQSVSLFSKEDLLLMEGFLDDDVIVKLYKLKGLPVPEVFIEDESAEDINSETAGKQPSGFFSRLATAFAVGEGVRRGVNDATGNKPRRFRVGDRVLVKYRGQEGTVVDINGDLYMVSMRDGAFVDSYTESQLQKAW
ncbi:MAG: hypothetical protein E7298_13665 [Lachnospiraceae bacterium]|nr:hypothetical protein [Lachnospiraceae bacterium]